MVYHDAKSRTVKYSRRKYTPKEEEFLGVNIQERIVSVSALEKLLRKTDKFCETNGFSVQLMIRFCDGADFVASDINEVIGFLKKDPANIENIDLHYEKSMSSGRYVVKNTTLAALKCEVTEDKFTVSAKSMDRAEVDFSSLLEDLKASIDHMPKKFDRLMQDRYVNVVKIGAAFGLWAAMLVMALPMLDARGREFYANNAFIYLFTTVIMAVILGAIMAVVFIIPLYIELLSGAQGQDFCDVAIGRKINFAKYRKIIAGLNKISLRLLIAGLVVLLLAPIVMIWLF